MTADGLRPVIARHGHNWESVVSATYEGSLNLLSDELFDIVIVDLPARDTGGIPFLRLVQERHPTTVRIVLSSSLKIASKLYAVSMAHQVLAKPCDPVELCNVLERVLALQTVLDKDAIGRAVGNANNLPAVPRLLARLQSMLTDPTVGAQEVATVIEQDPAMSARVLQFVNSAYFGLGGNVSTVRDAVLRLGFTMINNLVVSSEVFRSFSKYGHGHGLGLWIESLQNHSLLTANIAAGMFTDRRQSEDAFTAALLHDTGQLVLADRQPAQLRKLLAIAQTTERPMYVVEQELSEITHAEIGAYLLGLWGLPHPIVEAIAHHHQPARVEQLQFSILSAVYVANLLAHEYSRRGRPTRTEGETRLDLEYLNALGVTDQLPRWRILAARLAEA